MTEPKFTPGPWEALFTKPRPHGPTHVEVRRVWDTKTGAYLNRMVCSLPARKRTSGICQAASDAHLIAAAPLMYKALERLVAWNDLRKLAAAPIRTLDEIAEFAKKAMEKARGEKARED